VEGPDDGEGGSDRRVRIGGEEDCEHDLRRVGTDGSYNIYFECTHCAAGIVKFSETDDAGDVRPDDEIEEDLPQDPPTGTARTHPLIKGLTPESNGTDAEEGPLEKLESSLRNLFDNDRKK